MLILNMITCYIRMNDSLQSGTLYRDSRIRNKSIGKQSFRKSSSNRFAYIYLALFNKTLTISLSIPRRLKKGAWSWMYRGTYASYIVGEFGHNSGLYQMLPLSQLFRQLWPIIIIAMFFMVDGLFQNLILSSSCSTRRMSYQVWLVLSVRQSWRHTSIAPVHGDLLPLWSWPLTSRWVVISRELELTHWVCEYNQY